MKTLLFSLFLFLSLFSFSQKKDTHDSISKFILDLENSIIESINEHRSKNNIITVSRESVLDSASSYHNEYLKVLNGGNSKSFGIVHFESIKIDNLTYTGTNKILEMPKDRVLKFDKEKKFNNVNEIIFAMKGLSGIIDNPNKNSKKLAEYILKKWLDSKDHKCVVENSRLSKIGVSVFFNTELNTLCVVSVLSSKRTD